jgi:hypothetical protein
MVYDLRCALYLHYSDVGKAANASAVTNPTI